MAGHDRPKERGRRDIGEEAARGYRWALGVVKIGGDEFVGRDLEDVSLPRVKN